ncbi:MAG: rod shape-determining protein MreC [Deltaproteobacteria bacterium]|nr:rod shape-determining protein MreC [Deltaproteobacteria bacterium]
MLELLRKHKGFVVVGILLLLPLVLLYAQTKKGGGRGPLVGAFVDVAGIIERSMLFITGGISDGIEHYVTSVGSYEELAALRREWLSSEAQSARIAELSIENERLRALANAAADVDGVRPLGARVIARTGQPLTQLMSIDRGSSDGVRRGDGVISEDGVVGVVLVSGRLTSDVLLLSDPSSAIDVVVQKSRARGIVRGRGDADKYAAVVEDFDRLRDVSPGDAIVTSGIGARFPPGLLVGTVVDVKDKDDLTLEALVRPASVFSRLEHVAVLVGREAPRAPVVGDDDDDDELRSPSVRTRSSKRAPVAGAPGRAVAAGVPLLDGGTAIAADAGSNVVDAGFESPILVDAGPPVKVIVDAGPPVVVPPPPPIPPVEPVKRAVDAGVPAAAAPAAPPAATGGPP